MFSDKRKKPVEGAVNGWYVYVNAIVGKGYYIPFFVGVSNKEYEFRRYSNRPKDWNACACLKNKEFLATVLVDRIETYKIASMMYRIVIDYYHRRGNCIINDRVELKQTPYIDFNENINYHLAKIIKDYNVAASLNGHSMFVDMKKRNYHKKFLSTNSQ